MSDITKDDIRAAVASGAVTEAQAANILTIAQARQGSRDHMPADDEPFEFFNGFSEIFVTVGLGMLLIGFAIAIGVAGGSTIMSILGAALSWCLAMYFTKKRRMNLPSIGLSLGFGGFVAATYASIAIGFDNDISAMQGVIMGTIGMVAMAGYFAFFRLPFAAFVFGLFGIVTIMSIAAIGTGSPNVFRLAESIFDLSEGSPFAYASLVFGLFAFIGGMHFDMQDPHRVGRFSATGFWLHILAAPALVNTIALTALNLDGGIGYALTAVVLLLVCALAIIIDRRSFLTAGIGYLGALLYWALGNEGDGAPFLTFIIIGAFITALGTWWTPIRGRIMSALPDGTYKKRLPPYSEPS